MTTLAAIRNNHLDLYVGGLVLAFLLGMGVANGWATHEALSGQANYFVRDCHKKVVVATDKAEKKGIQTGVEIGYIAGQTTPH